MTADLDTRRAVYLQFYFMFGCEKGYPQDRDEGVLLQYSSNGGTEWHTMKELYFGEYRKAR